MPALDKATLVVFQDRDWWINPRLAVFTVYVDNRRVGKATFQGRCVVSIQPGNHSVRARQWWFHSRPLSLDVAQGQTVTVRADVNRSGGFARTFARAMLRPFRSVRLELVSPSPTGSVE